MDNTEDGLTPEQTIFYLKRLRNRLQNSMKSAEDQARAGVPYKDRMAMEKFNELLGPEITALDTAIVNIGAPNGI